LIPQDRWSANSSDLNSLDFCILNELDQVVDRNKVTSKATLIEELQRGGYCFGKCGWFQKTNLERKKLCLNVDRVKSYSQNREKLNYYATSGKMRQGNKSRLVLRLGLRQFQFSSKNCNCRRPIRVRWNSSKYHQKDISIFHFVLYSFMYVHWQLQSISTDHSFKDFCNSTSIDETFRIQKIVQFEICRKINNTYQK